MTNSAPETSGTSASAARAPSRAEVPSFFVAAWATVGAGRQEGGVLPGHRGEALEQHAVDDVPALEHGGPGTSRR